LVVARALSMPAWGFLSMLAWTICRASEIRLNVSGVSQIPRFISCSTRPFLVFLLFVPSSSSKQEHKAKAKGKGQKAGKPWPPTRMCWTLRLPQRTRACLKGKKPRLLLSYTFARSVPSFLTRSLARPRSLSIPWPLALVVFMRPQHGRGRTAWRRRQGQAQGPRLSRR
jgi:hypothetical protein